MPSVRLDPETDARVNAVAARTGLSKTSSIRAAIDSYIEDMDLTVLAEAALRDYDPSKNISHEQMKRELGLDA